MLRVDGEEPEIDVLVVRMPLLLDGGEAEASDDDRPGPGEQEAGDELRRSSKPAADRGRRRRWRQRRRARRRPRTPRRSARHSARSHRARCGDSAADPMPPLPPDPAQRQPSPDRRGTRQQRSRRRIKLVTFKGANFHRRAASSLKMLTPREQGDFGEMSAMHWLAWQGASVALPFGNSPHWDLSPNWTTGAPCAGQDLCVPPARAAGRSPSAPAAAIRAGTVS